MPDRPPLPRRDEQTATELLDRFLTALDVEVEAFAVCEVSRGWRLAFGPDDAPTVHYGLAGSGVLTLGDGRRLGVTEDTLLLLPPRTGHGFELAEGSTHEFRAGSALPSRAEGALKIRAGAGDPSLVVACGRISTGHAAVLGVLGRPGEPVVERFEDPRPLRGAFEAVLAELAAPTVGTRALTSALLKQCLVLLLRRRAAKGAGAAPWLPALADPRLAGVVLAMLERPADPRTLGDLARATGMSRSAFAERFSVVLGRPPLEFLKEVRLHRAARLLESTDLPIKAVASSVGYSSRSYFSRAFKRLHGIDPAGFRAQLARHDIAPRRL